MANGNGKPNCFVIMGYGKKTDYATGRKLDLDVSYTELIKPAVEAAGLECVRGDEVLQSAVIDVDMFTRLLDADLVIADLSTGNSNAFYELGVRHALRPHATIVIAENELAVPFDVNRVKISKYDHRGEGIFSHEVKRFVAHLAAVIKKVMASNDADSPVYTYLDLAPPNRKGQPSSVAPPAMAAAAGGDPVTVGLLRESVAAATRDGDWSSAQIRLRALLGIARGHEWAIQQLGLSTYKLADKKAKAKDVSGARTLYLEARGILESLRPATTADGETLGLWGAVFKRLYELENGVPQDQRADDEQTRGGYLDESIHALQRGFLILNDYYNGINLAYMLNVRARRSTGDDAVADIVVAKRVRHQVIAICQRLVDGGKLEGEERYWVLATLAEATYGVGAREASEQWVRQANEAVTADWMRGSAEEQLAKLGKLLE